MCGIVPAGASLMQLKYCVHCMCPSGMPDWIVGLSSMWGSFACNRLPYTAYHTT